MEIQYLCALCSQDLKTPTRSQTCQHIFCNVCIKNWLQRNNNCPLKCGVVHHEDLVTLKGEDLKNFDFIPFRCPFWKKGCQKILFKHDKISHEKECEFKNKRELKLINQENNKKQNNNKSSKAIKPADLKQLPQDSNYNCLSEITNTYASGTVNRNNTLTLQINEKSKQHQLNVPKQEVNNNSLNYDFKTETEMQDNEEYICCYMPTQNETKSQQTLQQQQQQQASLITCNCSCEAKVFELQSQIDFLKDIQKKFFDLCITSFQNSTNIQIQPFLELFQQGYSDLDYQQQSINNKPINCLSPRPNSQVAQKIDFQNYNQLQQSEQQILKQKQNQQILLEEQLFRTQCKNKSCHETCQKNTNTSVKSLHCRSPTQLNYSTTVSQIKEAKPLQQPKKVNINLLETNHLNQKTAQQVSTSLQQSFNLNNNKNSSATVIINNDIYENNEQQDQYQDNQNLSQNIIVNKQLTSTVNLDNMVNSKNSTYTSSNENLIMPVNHIQKNYQNMTKSVSHTRNQTAMTVTIDNQEFINQYNKKPDNYNFNKVISPNKTLQKSVDTSSQQIQGKNLSKNLGQILRSGSFIQQNQIKKEFSVNVNKRQQPNLQLNNNQQNNIQQKKQLYSRTANPSRCQLLSAQKQALFFEEQQQLQNSLQNQDQYQYLDQVNQCYNQIIKEANSIENIKQTEVTLATQLTEVEEGDDCKVNTKEFCTNQNYRPFKLNMANNPDLQTYRTDDIASEREITSMPNSGKEQFKGVTKLQNSSQQSDILEFNPQSTKNKIKLSPAQEKATIKKLIIKEVGKINGIYLKSDVGQLNEMKYIISMKWWRKWTDYVGFLDDGNNQNNYRNTHYEKPGFINNSDLVKINSIGKGRLPELKENLLEHHDYEVLSKEVFQYLKKWYNVDITVVRFLKQDPSDLNKLCLELYPEKYKQIKYHNKSVANLRTNTQGRFSLSKNLLTQSVGDLDIRQIQSLQTFDDEQIFSDRYNFNKKFVYNDLPNGIDKSQCQIF